MDYVATTECRDKYKAEIPGVKNIGLISSILDYVG